MPEAQQWRALWALALGVLVLEAPWLQQMPVASLLLGAQEQDLDLGHLLAQQAQGWCLSSSFDSRRWKGTKI